MSLEKGQELREKMFGSNAAKNALSNTKTLMPDLANWLETFLFGEVWQREALDLRSRSLVTVAALIGMGRYHQARNHMRGAMANGVTRDELKEVLYHLSFYCGIPSIQSIINEASDVLSDEQGKG